MPRSKRACSNGSITCIPANNHYAIQIFKKGIFETLWWYYTFLNKLGVLAKYDLVRCPLRYSSLDALFLSLVFNETSQLRPPIGLTICGLNCEVVLFLRLLCV